MARVHGRDLAFRQAGDGPVVVLVHGLGGSSAAWIPLMSRLADRFRLVAPDLPGHGDSARWSDCSLGSYASALRDLLAVLGHDQATFVGHSLGGGVVMQLAYQFPALCERVVLIAAGGLGPEVNPWLRVASLPGMEFVLPVVFASRLRDAAATAGRALGRVGARGNPRLGEVWATYSRLTDREAQRAFLDTVRSVIDVGGQRVGAGDRLYLAAGLPALVVWGSRDAVIPADHAAVAKALLPGCSVEIIDGVGHFPQVEAPEEVAAVLGRFLAATPSGPVPSGEWRERLRRGDPDGKVGRAW